MYLQFVFFVQRRIWRQNPSIEEEQTTQWSKEKRTNNDLENINTKPKSE